MDKTTEAGGAGVIRGKQQSAVLAFVLGGLMLSASGRSGAADACVQFELKGDYSVLQSNGIDVLFSFKQSGTDLSGTAVWTHEVREGDEILATHIRGGVHGTLIGENLNIEVRWNNNSTGVYQGTVSQNGMAGTNYDKQHPQARVSWYAEKSVSCAPSLREEKPASAHTDTGFYKPKPVSQAAAAGAGPIVSNAPPSRAPTASSMRVSDACMSGYVWRMARDTDHVCVTPESRALAANENRQAKSRWVLGAYGPHTCVAGYVWREAFSGDDVCVLPERRDAVRQENQMAVARRAGSG